MTSHTLPAGNRVYESDVTGGRIYECDPAAVERLRRLMAEERERRQQRQQQAAAAKQARPKPSATAARILKRAKQRKAEEAKQAKPAKQAKRKGPAPRPLAPEQLDAAIAAHAAGQTWRQVAAGLGVGKDKLRDDLRRAGYDLNQFSSLRRNKRIDISDGFNKK